MLAAKSEQLEIVWKPITYEARLDATDQVSSPSIQVSIPMHAGRLTVSLHTNVCTEVLNSMPSYIILTDF